MGWIAFSRIGALALGLALASGSPARAEDMSPASCARPATEIYAALAPRVVQVVSIGIDPFRVAGRVLPGSGSGILLSTTTVLTNYHVVHGGRLVGVMTDDWARDATLIGGDPALDVALLELAEPVPTGAALRFAPFDGLAVGQTAHVIGYPLGIGRTMSSGIVSGLDRLIPLNTISWTTRYIQTDAAISAGNSGGALVDACGRLVGLVTLRRFDPGAENMGYALPFDTVMPLVEEILETGHVARPWHGLYGQMVTPLIGELIGGFFGPQAGFLVETVEPGSAADRAGIRGGVFPILWGQSQIILGGDVILAVEGKPLETLSYALRAVESLEIGQTVGLVIWRDGEILELSAEIVERPAQESDLWFNGLD